MRTQVPGHKKHYLHFAFFVSVTLLYVRYFKCGIKFFFWHSSVWQMFNFKKVVRSISCSKETCDFFFSLILYFIKQLYCLCIVYRCMLRWWWHTLTPSSKMVHKKHNEAGICKKIALPYYSFHSNTFF